MGLVKISEPMHDNLRVASNALGRSINAQAEHWMRIGMMSELHPELTYGAGGATAAQGARVSGDGCR